MGKVSPFMPLDSSCYPCRPMTSRRGPLGTSMCPNALFGGLKLFSRAQYTFFNNDGFTDNDLTIATFPVPMPYAQDVRFVAYITYNNDESAFLYDESQWDVVAELCPRQAQDLYRGVYNFVPYETDSPLWFEMSGILNDMSAGDDLLQTEKVVQSNGGRNDVIKEFRSEGWRLPGNITSSYAFMRARLKSITPSDAAPQTCNMVIEAWVNQVVFDSDMNPRYGESFKPDHTQPAHQFWREWGVRSGLQDIRQVPAQTDRQLNVFGTKER